MCASINHALDKYGSLSRQWELHVHQPLCTVTVGSVAQSALSGVESLVHVIHPGVLIGKETDPKRIADVTDAFWATFCNAAQALVVSLNNCNECPMAPDEQLVLYQLLRAAVPIFPEVPAMECVIQLRQVLQAKKMHGNAGTRGLTAADGAPKKQKMDNQKDKMQAARPGQESIKASAVRRLIPAVKAIQGGQLAKRVFEGDIEQRHLFGTLVLNRLSQMHVIQNRLRVIGMMAHFLRAASATTGDCVRVFDRESSKNMLMDLVGNVAITSMELLRYGIVPELHSSFECLRVFGHEHL
jgi:hypothetical protein